MGPLPSVSDSVNLGWDPRTVISNKFPSDAAGPGTSESLSQIIPAQTPIQHEGSCATLISLFSKISDNYDYYSAINK